MSAGQAGHRALQVQAGQAVLKGLRVIQDLKDHKVQAALVVLIVQYLVHKESKDRVVPMAHKDRVVLIVWYLVHKAQAAQVELKVHKGQAAHPGVQAGQAAQEDQAVL
jgi:hypothetical protein